MPPPPPRATNQILAATGTDGVVDVGSQKPKLTVIEGGAADPSAPRATAGSGEGPVGDSPQVGGAATDVGPGPAPSEAPAGPASERAPFGAVTHG
jgi:hypothetical protein